MASRGWMALHAALALAAASFATNTASALDCKIDTDCAGTPRTPKCLPGFNICGCQTDSQCGGPTSGIICTGTDPAIGEPPYCIAGCSEADGRNKCPATQQCSQPSGGTGLCTQPCTTSLCAGPILTQCNILQLQNQCVECLSDANCRGKGNTNVCDRARNLCVVCTDNSACSNDPNGTLCRLPDEACGCNNDSQCAAGRICNNQIHACLPGCRVNADASGGGVCPPGDQCVSTDGGGDGQCVPIGDAGGSDSGIDSGGGSGDSGSGDGGGTVDSGSDSGGGGDSGAGDSGGSTDSGSDGGNRDGSVGDGSAGDGGDSGNSDGSVADGSSSTDGGGNGNDAGNGNDGGNNGNDGGNGNGNNGNYDTSLEGGGCDCTISPSAEDSLPIAGLIAVGGFLAIVTRRRKKGQA